MPHNFDGGAIMKNKYTNPSIEVQKFEKVDVIRTSGDIVGEELFEE